MFDALIPIVARCDIDIRDGTSIVNCIDIVMTNHLSYKFGRNELIISI